MIEIPACKVVEGIPCFHPDKIEQFESYPSFGHELGAEADSLNFWDMSRLRILNYEVRLLAEKFHHPNMLEIGCGDATFLNSIFGRFNLQLTGSELHLQALCSAKKKNPALHLIQLDATDIPFDNAYNIIGAFDVLEHIADDHSVLAGIYRALVPGGYLLITVPQHPFLWSSLDELVCHQRRYTRSALDELVQATGFEVQYISSFVFFLFPLMLVSRLVEKLRSSHGKQKKDFEKQIRFNPFLNATLNFAMRIDEWLLRMRISLPFGGTLLLVAKKPKNPQP